MRTCEQRIQCWSWVLTFAAIVSQSPVAHAAENELSAEEQAEGWQLLFNGKDHTGWKCNNGRPIATSIEEGCLQPHKAGGYLIVYEKPFANFKLQCDVKLSAPECNSGIFFRVSKLLNPVYTGFEVQVETSNGTGLHDFGAIYDLVPPTKAAAKPTGEFNHVLLACDGPLFTVEVNGEDVAQMNCDDFKEKGRRPDGSRHKFGAAMAALPREGYIGFQDHGQNVWYKNVKLLELKN